MTWTQIQDRRQDAPNWTADADSYFIDSYRDTWFFAIDTKAKEVIVTGDQVKWAEKKTNNFIEDPTFTSIPWAFDEATKLWMRACLQLAHTILTGDIVPRDVGVSK